jgi:hypothetical protein
LLFDRLTVSIQDKIAVGIALIGNDVLLDKRRSEDTDTCLTLTDKAVEVVLQALKPATKVDSGRCTKINTQLFALYL